MIILRYLTKVGRCSRGFLKSQELLRGFGRWPLHGNWIDNWSCQSSTQFGGHLGRCTCWHQSSNGFLVWKCSRHAPLFSRPWTSTLGAQITGIRMGQTLVGEWYYKWLCKYYSVFNIFTFYCFILKHPCKRHCLYRVERCGRRRKVGFRNQQSTILLFCFL